MPDDVMLSHPLVGRTIAVIPTPAPLVDLDVLDANIAAMATFFSDRPAHLRPHANCSRAKVSMAEAMVDDGVTDVIIANQIVAPKAIVRLCRLAAQRAAVSGVADETRNVVALSEAAQFYGVKRRTLVEMDGGIGRCGTAPGAPTLALAAAIARAPGLDFAGIHVYEGHVVQHPKRAIRKAETKKMLGRVRDTRDLIEQHGLPAETFTCGGTGPYDISGVYPSITEHQVGSYVYMDPGYHEKVPVFELAFTLLCAVISRPTTEKVFTDGGLQMLRTDGTSAAQTTRSSNFAISRRSTAHSPSVMGRRRISASATASRCIQGIAARRRICMSV